MTITKLETPCREWMGHRNEKGYGRRLVGAAKTRKVLLHRWVWEECNGPIPDGLIVMHMCDNPPCYRLDHLRLGTRADNVADMVTKGRQMRGEGQPLAKLTAEQVLEIYARPDEQHLVLAREYGVADTTVRRIRTGESWSHVTGHPLVRRQQVTK